MLKVKNYVNVTINNTTTHNPRQPHVPDNSYKILITGGSGLRETIVLLNLINHQPDIDEIYLYAKDPYKVI